MTPIKNFLAVTTAAMIGVTGITGALPVTAFAHEPPAANQEAGVDSGILPIRESAEKAGLDVIYVRSLADYGGDGSKDHPLKDFKDAYRQVKENGRIVLLDATPIQNDDNNNDQGIFTFSKPVTIEGQESGVLSARVPVQLAADVTFKNVGFYASEVYLNGHTMTMENVTNYKSNDRRPTFFGGSYQNKPVNQGPKSTLNITGSVGNPLQIQAIYSGSEEGQSDLPVSLRLESGVKVLEKVHAGGIQAKTTGAVDIYASNVNIKEFLNEFGTEKTSLTLSNFHPANTVVVDGYQDVTLDGSRIPIKTGGKLDKVKNLKVQNGSTLDISESNQTLTVDTFAGTADSKLILHKEGLLSVNGPFTGSIELRTPGADVATSGAVNQGHTYIQASNTSSGNVEFKPFLTQKNLSMVVEESNSRYSWVARQNNLAEITSIDVNEAKQIKIADDTVAEFTMVYSTKDHKPLNYTPQLETSFRGPDGQMVNEYDIVANFDNDPSAAFNPAKLTIEVTVDTLTPGTYTLIAKDMVSKRTFEIAFEFYRTEINNHYTVRFMPNGGDGQEKQQSLTLGADVTLDKNSFTREGHSFQGWALTESGSVAYQDGAVVRDLAQTAGQVVNLYAVWAPNRYNVTFDSQNGSQNETQSVTYGQFVTEPGAPTKTGYTFAGWYTDESYNTKWNFGSDTMPAENITLYAKWDVNSYQVRFDSMGGSAVSDQSVTYGHSITEPGAPVKAGHTFAGWYTDESYNTKWDFDSDTMPAENITLYAKWERTPVPFQDVRESDYFYEAVQWAVARGITAGASPTQFDPHGRSTRAQSVTMLWRRFNSPEVGAGHGFDDVSGGDYYEKSVRWAKSLGVVSGVAPGQFDPHGVTTRGQIVTMLWRAAGSPIVEDDTVFTDVRADDYFAQAVKWAKAKGITAGIGGGKFGPHEPCTRAQMVSFLYKF